MKIASMINKLLNYNWSSLKWRIFQGSFKSQELWPCFRRFYLPRGFVFQAFLKTIKYLIHATRKKPSEHWNTYVWEKKVKNRSKKIIGIFVFLMALLSKTQCVGRKQLIRAFQEVSSSEWIDIVIWSTRLSGYRYPFN